jgi:hypothetical protein
MVEKLKTRKMNLPILGGDSNILVVSKMMNRGGFIRELINRN